MVRILPKAWPLRIRGLQLRIKASSGKSKFLPCLSQKARQTRMGTRFSLSPKSQEQAADDADVGDVEDWPPLQIDEINYCVVTHKVEQISGGATEGQAQADLRYASVKPHAGAMERNRGKECHEPEDYENSAGAGAAVDSVEIYNAA